MRISHVASGIDSQKLSRYRLGKEIGYGPGTVIYLAQDIQTGKEVALKVINTSMYPVSGKEKLMKEVIYHQMVSGHPNIIAIYDHFKVGDSIYIVMEFAPNSDLFKLLKYSRASLDDHQKRKLLYQVCSAIQHIHSKNMLHRDIKPENILLDNQMNAKLCDFGWACHIDDVKSRYANAGTFEYMSPECLRQQLQGKPADIWSLGILAYELYHGKEPFSGKSKEELLNAIYNGKAIFNSDCPEDIVDVFEQTVRYEPGNRLTIDQLMNHHLFDSVRNEVQPFQRNAPVSRQNMVRHSGHVSHSVGYKRPQFFEETSHPLNQPMNTDLSKVIAQSNIQTQMSPMALSHSQFEFRRPAAESQVVLSRQLPQRVPIAQRLVNALTQESPIRSMSAGLTRQTSTNNFFPPQTPVVISSSTRPKEISRVNSSGFEIDLQTHSPSQWQDLTTFKTLQDRQFKTFTTNTFFAPPSQTLLKPFNSSLTEGSEVSNREIISSQVQSGSNSPNKLDRNPLRLKKSISGREELKRGSAMQMLEAPRFSRTAAMINSINTKAQDSPPISRTSFSQALNQQVPAQNLGIDPRQSPTLSDRRSKAPIKAIRVFEHRGNQRSFHDESTIDKVDPRVDCFNIAFQWYHKT